VAAKAAKQIVKSAHPDSVLSYLNQRVNVDSVMYVRVERGIWEAGKNSAVDKYGFKNKAAEYTPSEEFPIVVPVGKVIKSPQEYTDERAKVTTDYQDYLEKAWIKTLREKYPVVINEEVWAEIKQ
jgi:peptidyl-prolyl cis-trans isomerase SurA